MTLTHKKIVAFLLPLLFFLSLTFDAYASQGMGGSLPYESWLASLRNSITGPVAFSLSIIGIVMAGAALIFGGEISGFFKTLIFLVLVMSLLVGSQSLLSNFFMQGAEIKVSLKEEDNIHDNT